MTKQLEARFQEVGRQDDSPDPRVVAKFFNPSGPGTWYATEYDPESRIFYGYVSIFGDHCDEWGSFSLAELEGYRGPFGLGLERDLFFREAPISQVEPKAVHLDS